MANVDVWAGFMIFHDDYDRLRFLPGDQKLKVLDAVCEFSKSGEVVDMGEPMMNIVYDILIKAVTRARAKSINAKKGHANKGVGKDDADADSAESCNVLQIPAHFCNDLHTSGDTCAPMQHKDKGKPDYKSDAKSGSNLDATACDRMQPDSSALSRNANGCEPMPQDANTNNNQNTTTTSNDSAMSEVIRYCQNAMMFLSERHMDEIRDYLNDGINAEMQMHAVDLTLENGSKAWAYTKKILTRWRDNGIRTLDAARTEQAAFRARKQGQGQESGKGWMAFDV